jgi:hypothetical protein
MAQLVEHLICNEGVRGSNPRRSTLVFRYEFLIPGGLKTYIWVLKSYLLSEDKRQEVFFLEFVH